MVVGRGVVVVEVVVVVLDDVTGASVDLSFLPPKNFLIPLKKPDFLVVASRGFSDVGSSPSAQIKPVFIKKNKCIVVCHLQHVNSA